MAETGLSSGKLEGLNAILEKEEVISTVSSDTLIESPDNVDFYYKKHVQTYIPMGEVEVFTKRLFDSLKKGPVSGAIVAEYGYGKTSTLLYIWNKLGEKDSYIVVPPFQFKSLMDIAKAVYGWSRFKLSQKMPDLVPELDRVYEEYFSIALSRVAERYSKQHQMPQDHLVRILEELKKDGLLILTLTPIELNKFLGEVLSIIKRAGYTGIVILPDEFQDYFRKDELKNIVNELREFLWDLLAREHQIGIIFGMPIYSEAILNEIAEDILHRLKKFNLYYNLKEIYTRDFPKRLWERYTALFNIQDEIINWSTLLSIGQILEREDIGEGPRSVIEFFKRAVSHFKNTGSPYTPIDLVEDILNGKVAFETSKYKFAIKNALSNKHVDSEEKARAIKLIAAFPQGCPSDIQKKFELYGTINELSRYLHGTVLTYLPEGYALVDLQKSEKSKSTIDIIIQKFWRTYDEDSRHQEMALDAFVSFVIPELFNQKQGTKIDGWKNLKPTKLSTGIQFVIDGTFSPKYPKRKIVINVVKSDEDLPITETYREYHNADFEIDFVLSRNRDDRKSGRTELRSQRWVVFHLNLLREPPMELPDDIKKLQTLVNPQLVTPLLLLSLVQYFNTWNDPTYPILESEKDEINYFMKRMTEKAIIFLFDNDLRESISGELELQQIGKYMIRELFMKLCEVNYPEYRTLIRTPRYEAYLIQYTNALEEFSLKVRRGHTEVTISKEALAKIFGQTKYTTFKTIYQSQYLDLMEIKNETSKEVTVIFKLHPFEQKILDLLKERSELTKEEIVSLGRKMGYTIDEIKYLLDILYHRGYIEVDTTHGKIWVSDRFEVSIDELKQEVNSILTQLETAGISNTSPSISKMYQELQEIKRNLSNEGLDMEDLDQIRYTLRFIQIDLQKEISTQINKEKQQLHSLRSEAMDLKSDLETIKKILKKDISGKVSFVQHLHEMKEKLRKNYRRIQAEVTNLEKDIRDKIDNQATSIEDLKLLIKFIKTTKQKERELRYNVDILKKTVSDWNKWVDILHKADEIFSDLAYFPDLKDPFDQLIYEIMHEFANGGTSTLSQWEIYQTRIDDIKRQLDEKKREMHSEFGRTKERYQTELKKIRHKDPTLRARFIYVEVEESYEELYREIEDRVKEKIQDALKDVEAIKNDILQIKQTSLDLQPEDKTKLEEIYRNLSKIEKRLEQESSSNLKETIQDLQLFTEYCDSLSSMFNDIETYRIEVKRIANRPVSLTEKEKRVLQRIPKRQLKNLAEIISVLTRELKMTPEEIIKILISLHKKNLVSLYVEGKD